jgi:putative ABC transport system substrate-binding protein
MMSIRFFVLKEDKVMKHGNQTILLAASALLGIATLTGCGSSAPKVGILTFGSFEALTNATDGFVAALSDAGFKDGDKISLIKQNPEADMATNTSMAQTLAASCSLVYGVATPSASALKNAISTMGSDIPLVFSAVTDPVGAKLVASLDKPGANVTGASDLGPIAEEINLLSEFSGIDKVAVLYNSAESNSIYQINIAQPLMEAKGWSVVAKTVTKANEITAAVSAIDSDVDALFIPTDDLVAANMATVKSANEARTGHPLIIAGCDSGMISGSVLAMGVDYYQLGVQAGQMAAKILNGTKPADIPVETSEKSVVKINKTWATSLGISLPEALLATPGAVII